MNTRNSGGEEQAAAVISDYGLLGDCQGAALVSREGSVDWWCPARFDAPSVFGRLLDVDAGYWLIRPTEDFTVNRRYLPGTMVVETDFHCESGDLRLTDSLSLGMGERGHQIGHSSPHLLVRRLEVSRGHVQVRVELAPRLEYGLITPGFTRTAAGWEIAGGADRLSLTGDIVLDVENGCAGGTFTLNAGESAAFALQHRSSVDSSVDGSVDDVGGEPGSAARLSDTIAAWRSWGEIHQSYEGPYREQVQRSVLVLQALTYRPTGAVVAAATTSLPEEPGGSANWDYRFGWLRDGSLTLKALWIAACADEGQQFFDWITSSAGPTREGHLQIMFGVGGEHDLSEHSLDHLTGYAQSRPVRVGNEAWSQTQLDVLGEVFECAWILRDQLGELSAQTAGFLVAVADRAAGTWHEKDSGIWEGREGDRNYLTSKLMCWVALDRAVKLADRLDAADRVAGWESERDKIRAAILERGWNSDVNAFTGAFDSDHLDAGVLLMPMMGFLPATDNRVLATMDTIERDLSTGALVQRWTDAGDEGAFIICSYWLAAGRAMAGQIGQAKKIFETVTGYANDLGLLSEEVHIHEGTLIGNFPQGLSHIGLITAASAIAQAEHPENQQDRQR
ncbi:glycoside hydrolase family 15 protein [Arthrobacter sp. Br18]|uniref:glycoside hydrolase family 15 protein n=1 Tax=Arthrobacter sp. Br18 TaxID=1312954 RepID=UPI0004B77615|nr:glycoside hydrolase family 15 protein [Arthrobacter sp. Br18]